MVMAAVNRSAFQPTVKAIKDALFRGKGGEARGWTSGGRARTIGRGA